MKTDISIDGQGFYSIASETKRGDRWLKRNVDGRFSDDTRLTRDIADGALRAGLRVAVNGNKYLGKG